LKEFQGIFQMRLKQVTIVAIVKKNMVVIVFRNWNRQNEIQPNWYQMVTCFNLIWNIPWNSFKLYITFTIFYYNTIHTPQGVENRNILLWFKCVLTALHVNCIFLFDKVLYIEQEKNVHLSEIEISWSCLIKV
jgi:hypothetical protein